MKLKHILAILSIASLSWAATGSDYAMIGDRAVRLPESESSFRERLESIVVCEFLQLNGKDVERAKIRKSGDYDYVLAPEGTHTFKIKKRAWGKSDEKGEIVELTAPVKTGLMYEARWTGSTIELIEIKK